MRTTLAAAAAAILALAGTSCSRPGQDLVRYPSGCLRIHPAVSVEEHNRADHGWGYDAQTQTWWDPQDGFIAVSLTEGDAIWAGRPNDLDSYYACARTHGGSLDATPVDTAKADAVDLNGRPVHDWSKSNSPMDHTEP